MNAPLTEPPSRWNYTFQSNGRALASYNGDVYIAGGILSSLFTLTNVAAFRNSLFVGAESAVMLEGYYTPGDGGGGLFVNLGLGGPADNGGTIFVSALGYSWARVQSGPGTLTQFGGVADGVTHNKAAFDAMAAAQDTLIIDPGNWFFEASSTIALASGENFVLSGAGIGVTNIIFATAAGWTITYADGTIPVTVRDMTFQASGVGAQTAITLTQLTAIVAPAYVAPTTLTDLVFRGSDGYAINNYFATSIKVNQVSNIDFYNVSIYGYGNDAGWVPNGVGVDLEAGLNGGPITNNFGVVYNFTGCNWNLIGIGINYGKAIQGVTCSGCNWTGGYYGIFVPSGLAANTLDQINIINSQFNVFDSGVIDASGVTNIAIQGSSFLLPQAAATGISLEVGAGFVIHGNTFESLVGVTTTNGIVVGPTASNYAGVISGNYFNTLATAVNLQAGSQNINVQANAYVGVTNQVVNSGTGNSVGVATK